MLTLPHIQAPQAIEPTPNNTSKPSSQEVLKVYIASGGIVTLALERLRKSHPSSAINEADIYELLSNPTILSQLQQATRSSVITHTYEAALQAIVLLKMRLSTLEPFELSRTTSNLLAQLQELTAPPRQSTEVNLNNIVYENLIPEQAMEAIKFLQQRRLQAQPLDQQEVNTPQQSNYNQDIRPAYQPNVIEHATEYNPDAHAE